MTNKNYKIGIFIAILSFILTSCHTRLPFLKPYNSARKSTQAFVLTDSILLQTTLDSNYLIIPYQYSYGANEKYIYFFDFFSSEPFVFDWSGRDCFPNKVNANQSSDSFNGSKYIYMKGDTLCLFNYNFRRFQYFTMDGALVDSCTLPKEIFDNINHFVGLSEDNKQAFFVGRQLHFSRKKKTHKYRAYLSIYDFERQQIKKNYLSMFKESEKFQCSISVFGQLDSAKMYIMTAASPIFAEFELPKKGIGLRGQTNPDYKTPRPDDCLKPRKGVFMPKDPELKDFAVDDKNGTMAYFFDNNVQFDLKQVLWYDFKNNVYAEMSIKNHYALPYVQNNKLFFLNPNTKKIFIYRLE